MEINKCKQLFNLNEHYTINELKENYNKLLLKYHKENNNDIDFYNKLKDYYSILLSYCLTNKTNNINNINNSINSNIDKNNISNINRKNNINNTKNNLLFFTNSEDIYLNNDENKIIPINNRIKDSNNYLFEENNNYLSKEYCFVDSINLELEITFEEAYNGSSKPILINRIINNFNNITKEIENFYLKIPNGIDNNEIINIPKKGNCFNNNYGDIKILIKLLNHDIFKRNGLDLYLNKNISLKEALLGFEFEFLFLNNKKYKINNNNILICKTKTIRNLGFIRDTFKGNLIINFNIIFPEKLSTYQKETLEAIL